MAKHNNKGRSKGGLAHVRIHHWLMKSEAWQALKPGPRALLIELYALYNGDNNGELYLSEREAAKRCNISKATARTYLVELQDKGFIYPKIKGSFNVKAREATIWILTEFGYNGNSATKDFMSWKTPKKQNTGIKFVPVGTKIYTRDYKNVVPITPDGTKICTR